MGRSSAIAAALCACALLTACGGGDDDGDRAAQGTPTPAERSAPRTTPTPPPGGNPLALPPGVPTTPLRPRTSDEDRRVIAAWADALIAGDIERAASYFARGAAVQNGTPVIRLGALAERVAFNASLPCGARPVRYGSGDGHTIVEFVLRERRGGDCGGAAGQRARCAIKVDDGKITGWYRLSDDEVPEIEPGTNSAA